MPNRLTGSRPPSNLESIKNNQASLPGDGKVHMRDTGLCQAIDAAGGVAQLARKIGIAQPSLSNWNRVPAERVVAVEAATGVARRQLRPDLYSETTVEDQDV